MLAVHCATHARQVSGFVLMTLCGVSAELNRGGNLLDRPLMSELVSMLSAQLLLAYEALLAAGTAVSQDGAVQLLFDVNFVADVLSARAHLDSDEHKQHVARLDAVRARLREAVDPFDMIIYERPLADARARYYIRCEVLLGNFTRLNRLHVGAKTATTTERDNMIALAPAVPRFPLLPVSAPKAPAAPAAAPPALNGHQPKRSVFERLASM